MLTPKTLETIRAQTLVYWREEVLKQDIIAIARGKEIGHKLADLVDEKTTELLTRHHIVAQERDKEGHKRQRGMGDLWLRENGIYHAINVKTGVAGSEGSPNLVSLKKVLKAIMTRQIDSYYLLIVKMQINGETITPSVYLVDMLDWLDYVTFDSGPGQMMLRAAGFYTAFDSVNPHPLTIEDKLKDS